MAASGTNNCHQLYGALDRNDPHLKIEGTDVRLLDGTRGPMTIHVARDFPLENGVTHYLTERVSMETILRRARAHGTPTTELPRYYPVRLVAANNPAVFSNYLLVLPDLYGLEPSEAYSCRALEVVCYAEANAAQILVPTLDRLADTDTRKRVARELLPAYSEIYSAWSLFHDLGHALGPYKILPSRDCRVKVTDRQIAHLGEAFSDTLASELVPEAPWVTVLMVLTRIFVWGRRGFGADPELSEMNSDYDVWLGGAILRRAVKWQGLTLDSRGKMHLDSGALCGMAKEMFADLKALAVQLRGRSVERQVAVAAEWMKTEVEQNASGQFRLTSLQRSLYERLSDLPEKPRFAAPLSLAV